ncbi:MAG TPA: thioredoxin family protein [Candidatus Nosocomiicoccus stercorigallinarum]|nr:thioredoxin family protein [Candidatus Nosocomiicoccus stercorigallinarum]
MNNKIFYAIIAVIIIGFLGAFLFLKGEKNDPDNLSDSGYYPYTDKEPSELQGPTIDKLDDENYQLNETPESAKQKIDSGEEIFVYYWSPVCEYCLKATPLLMEAKDKEDFPLIQVNVLEYQTFQREQGIEATPTLIYYKDGKEVTRAEGAAETADNYLDWINRAREEK